MILGAKPSEIVTTVNESFGTKFGRFMGRLGKFADKLGCITMFFDAFEMATTDTEQGYINVGPGQIFITDPNKYIQTHPNLSADEIHFLRGGT